MNRLIALKHRCKNHILYSRLARKLSEDEFDEMVAWLKEHDKLDHLEFEYAVNRMHLDKPNKPRHWTSVQDLLLAANSAVHKPLANNHDVADKGGV